MLLDKDILEIWVFEDVVSRNNVDSDVMMLDIKVVGSVDIILLEILVLDKVENNLVGDCFWFGVDDSDPIVLLVYRVLEVVKITVDEYVIDVIANVEVSVAILLLEVDEVEPFDRNREKIDYFDKSSGSVFGGLAVSDLQRF